MDRDRELDELEIVELEAEEEVYSAPRLLMVAAMGALASLGLYYVYQQLDEEKRNSLRRKASGLVAEQIHRLTDVGQDEL